MPKLRDKAYPSDILKGCLILGIQPEELTEDKVRSCVENAAECDGSHPGRGICQILDGHQRQDD